MENANQAITLPVTPNLADYDKIVNSFNWVTARKGLDGLPGKKGLNIAYEAVERHAKGKLSNNIALRCIQKR